VNYPVPQADTYTYRVEWSQDDQQFVGTVAEFPSLSWLAKTPEMADAGIRGVVAQTLNDIVSSGGTVPAPHPRYAPPPQPQHYPAPGFQMPQYSTAPAQGVNQSVNVVVGGYGAKRGIGAGWHIFHCVMTLLTCVWGFVWIAHVALNNK
jgi:predicted RNase H-like HicB family nuclease